MVGRIGMAPRSHRGLSDLGESHLQQSLTSDLFYQRAGPVALVWLAEIEAFKLVVKPHTPDPFVCLRRVETQAVFLHKLPRLVKSTDLAVFTVKRITCSARA